MTTIFNVDNRVIHINFSEKSKHTYAVLSIDIGVLHLGISISILDIEYKLIDIIWIDLIDITKFIHNKPETRKTCKLNHTKTFTDWLEHVFYNNRELFDLADYILIERQPPCGFVVVEQLIFSKWRHKSILISPNSMHAYFKIGHLDYEGRKDFNNKLILNILSESLKHQLDNYDRIHDISDSICLMLFWINRKQIEYCKKLRKKMILERRYKIINDTTISTSDWLDLHKYIPRVIDYSNNKIY